MWHDDDIDFVRWLHPAMCHVALDRDSEFTQRQHPALWYVALGWHAIESSQWQHPLMWHVALKSWHLICHLAAPCNVAGGSGMTCYWIRSNVNHIGGLHLVSISTTSRQSTCHSAPDFEILSKSDHPWQKKMTSCRFSSWRISAILDFKHPIMGSLKSLIKLLSFPENRVFASICKMADLHFGDRLTDKQTSRWTAPMH